jgi:hypothetical protein
VATSSPAPDAPGVSRIELRPLAPPIGLLILLAVASLLPPGTQPAGLRLASPDRTRVEQMRALVAGLPSQPVVLVGFDPDLGTYPEIRATVRAVVDDLTSHGARLAVVSFTPEGRALAAAEIDRLARRAATGGGTAADVLDIGFVSGAEAGMVRAVSSIVPSAATGPLAASIRARGGGIGAFDLVVIVSGGDLGARSWIEQVGSRLRDVPMAAVAPTFLEPELAPYLRSGQLQALLATLREGVAYAEEVPVSGAVRDRAIPALPMLVGMLVALLWLAAAGMQRATGRIGPSSHRGGLA